MCKYEKGDRREIMLSHGITEHHVLSSSKVIAYDINDSIFERLIVDE